MKQDAQQEDQTETLEQQNLTVEPRWARPKTEHRAQTNLIKSFFRPEPSLSLRPDPPACN